MKPGSLKLTSTTVLLASLMSAGLLEASELSHLGGEGALVAGLPEPAWTETQPRFAELLDHNYTFAVEASGPAGEVDQRELAKAAQNPVAPLIQVPIQTNFNFGTGADDDLQLVNLVQPVIPQKINETWNWMHRPIVPVPVVQPGIPGGPSDTAGLGDIQYQGFLGLENPSKLIWGVGPFLSFPTATDDILGSGKWSAGPAAVLLAMPGDFVMGILFTHLWSFAGDDGRDEVNSTSVQPFINYNIPNGKGWFLTSDPTFTYDWSADTGQRWTIPLGGGIGRIFKIGNQHVNVSVQAFGYVDAPDGGPDWTLQTQFTLLFPK